MTLPAQCLPLLTFVAHLDLRPGHSGVPQTSGPLGVIARPRHLVSRGTLILGPLVSRGDFNSFLCNSLCNQILSPPWQPTDKFKGLPIFAMSGGGVLIRGSTMHRALQNLRRMAHKQNGGTHCWWHCDWALAEAFRQSGVSATNFQVCAPKCTSELTCPCVVQGFHKKPHKLWPTYSSRGTKLRTS